MTSRLDDKEVLFRRQLALRHARKQIGPYWEGCPVEHARDLVRMAAVLAAFLIGDASLAEDVANDLQDDTERRESKLDLR